MKTSTFCILGLFLLPTLASGATPLMPGPEIQVHDEVAARGLDLAVGASGGFLVSWGTNTQPSIYGRAYSPTEQPAETRVLSTPPHRALPAAMAALASGLYVVVWGQRENTTEGPILARLLDSAGRPVGEVFELALQGPLQALAVAAQPAGGLVVAWKIGNSIMARRFDGAGAPAGEEIRVTSYGEVPDIASLPNGGFVVAWMIRGPQGRRVHARSFGPDGAPASAELSVETPPGTGQSEPRVVADAGGRFVLAWTEEDVRSRVRLQRFSAIGEALGPALVATEDPGGRSDSLRDVAARPNGSVLVLFQRQEPPPDFGEEEGGDLMVRAFDASGTALGDALRVTEVKISFFSSAVVEASAEGWTVSWSLVGQTPDFHFIEGIFVRSFSPGCGGPASALCLGSGRFRVEVAWKTPAGASGVGSPIPLTDDTGAFWFFSPSNYELNVKILDGRASNGHFWVFYGSLTNVEFDLTVTDTATGQQRTYHNPAGTMASRADTSAF